MSNEEYQKELVEFQVYQKVWGRIKKLQQTLEQSFGEKLSERELAILIKKLLEEKKKKVIDDAFSAFDLEELYLLSKKVKEPKPPEPPKAKTLLDVAGKRWGSKVVGETAPITTKQINKVVKKIERKVKKKSGK